MNRALHIMMLMNEAVCKQRQLYFGSSTQNLPKNLHPQPPQSTHRGGIKKSLLYATDEKSYAAVFTFPWSEVEGFEFGKYGLRGIYTLKIPYRFIFRLKKPCSIYTVQGCFSKLRTSTPEFISYDTVKNIKEEKYVSVSDCLKKNNVRVTVVKVSKKSRR